MSRDAGTAPLLRVINGDATPEEVAALVAVSPPSAGAGDDAPSGRVRVERPGPRVRARTRRRRLAGQRPAALTAQPALAWRRRDGPALFVTVASG